MGVWTIAGVFSFLLGIPLIGYVAAAIFKTVPEQWAPVCSVDQINAFQPREFRIAFKGTNAPHEYEDVRGVFVIRKDGEILVFTNVCTHMGCSVRWVDWREQILCPCHGGTYDRWGNLVGGPPARSLPFFVWRVEQNTVYVANRLVKR